MKETIYEFVRGKIRVRGDCVEIYPFLRRKSLKIPVPGDEIEKISELILFREKILNILEKIVVYPAKHFIASSSQIEYAFKTINMELEERLNFLKTNNKLLEATAAESRTKYDMEMLKEVGYCHGIENYSRHLSGRAPGTRPSCLIDYFPEDFLTIFDESHVTVPRSGACTKVMRKKKGADRIRLPPAFLPG